jgi:hypothetical protein
MKAANVITDALKTVGICAGLGVGLGVLAGLYKEHRRVSDRNDMEIRLPSMVSNMPDIKDSIVIMADAKYADLYRLERVARRCETLLQLLASLENADPRTVRASISSVASEIEASILHHLGLFYHSSWIAVSEVQYKQIKVHVPTTRDMLYAHDMLMKCVEGLVHDVHLGVKSKLELVF